MLVTDDDGTYLADTRDVTPERMQAFEGIEDDAQRVIEVVRAHTVKRSDERSTCPPRRRACSSRTCGWPTRRARRC